MIRRVKVKVHARWRKQAQRLIAEARVYTGGDIDPQELRRLVHLNIVSAREAARAHMDHVRTFNVAVVRSYCERLIAEADADALEREVFTDWTRARGKGPESGGWPGSLAREYVAERAAKRRCSRRDCDGGVLRGDLAANMSEFLGATGNVTITSTDCGCGVACPECEREKVARPSRSFANGGNLRGAAQRLLDTLDGRCPWAPDATAQASTCGCAAYPDPCDPARPYRVDARGSVCTRCGGTGRNLHGYLPPLPAETRRRLTRSPRVMSASIGYPADTRSDDRRDALTFGLAGMRGSAIVFRREQQLQLRRLVFAATGAAIEGARAVMSDASGPITDRHFEIENDT